ncbi:MAG: hypothetical protein H0V70_07045 [Ktedonobacteraceae bacterium]|nr:hypothetical protein [Ktedonobacteraceae bacterium]
MNKCVKRKQESHNVPDKLELEFSFITGRTDGFCELYLNEAYADLCCQLTIMLCRKQPSPLVQGRDSTWACAIVHAFCVVNDLFNPALTPHVSASLIANYFALSFKTMQAKSKQIRDLLDIAPQDPAGVFLSITDKNQ